MKLQLNSLWILFLTLWRRLSRSCFGS